uniref:DprA-like DNA recombination-mediator protein n=1 Tax=Ochrobactrum phage ORM_20 TaxID=2985243 RepID=A0A9N6ZF12_9VIRU|nr:DprA-like DNA recombination-mediator protein [Ochrobactrum phage ORM_20]
MDPKTKIFAGIGSRDTPVSIRDQAVEKGLELAERGFFLRSGGARGFDRAIACLVPPSMKRIFRPHEADNHPEWFEHASQFHPKWDKLNDSARALHARNSPIILGEDLDERVDFILCWTEGGKIKGGTGQGLRIAASLKIPVFNMASVSWEEDLEFFLAYF